MKRAHARPLSNARIPCHRLVTRIRDNRLRAASLRASSHWAMPCHAIAVFCGLGRSSPFETEPVGESVVSSVYEVNLGVQIAICVGTSATSITS